MLRRSLSMPHRSEAVAQRFRPTFPMSWSLLSNAVIKEPNMKKLFIVALCLFAVPAFAVFSVDLPIVTHAVGASATFYTSMDVTNNTAQPTGVNYEYVSSDLSVDVSGTLVAALGAHGNFHTDD